MNPLIELKNQFLAGKISKPDFISQMYSHHMALHNFEDLLKQSDVLKLEISDQGVVATMRGDEVKILLTPGDERLAPLDALNFGRYEQEELDMALNLLADCKVMVDIGANVGWYSLKCSRRYPSLDIFAFEPLPRTFSCLKQNLALNNASKIQPANSGFSDQAGDLVFYFDPKGSVNASLRNVADKSDIEKIHCHVDTVDNYRKNLGRSIDFIKCDVEGAELLVLKGAVETLKQDRPALFVEMLRKWSAKFGYHPNDIIDLMTSLGYRCFTVENDKLLSFEKVDDSTTATNYFFLHSQRHQNTIQAKVRS